MRRYRPTLALLPRALRALVPVPLGAPVREHLRRWVSFAAHVDGGGAPASAVAARCLDATRGWGKGVVARLMSLALLFDRPNDPRRV